MSALSRIIPPTVTSEDGGVKCGLLPRQSSMGGSDVLHSSSLTIDGNHATGGATVAEGPPTPTHSEITECAKGKECRIYFGFS